RFPPASPTTSRPPRNPTRHRRSLSPKHRLFRQTVPRFHAPLASFPPAGLALPSPRLPRIPQPPPPPPFRRFPGLRRQPPLNLRLDSRHPDPVKRAFLTLRLRRQPQLQIPPAVNPLVPFDRQVHEFAPRHLIVRRFANPGNILDSCHKLKLQRDVAFPIGNFPSNPRQKSPVRRDRIEM